MCNFDLDYSFEKDKKYVFAPFGSFKSAKHKKTGSANRKSAKRHFCRRSSNLTNLNLSICDLRTAHLWNYVYTILYNHINKKYGIAKRECECNFNKSYSSTVLQPDFSNSTLVFRTLDFILFTVFTFSSFFPFLYPLINLFFFYFQFCFTSSENFLSLLYLSIFNPNI